jgi:hypothetical protein
MKKVFFLLALLAIVVGVASCTYYINRNPRGCPPRYHLQTP